MVYSVRPFVGNDEATGRFHLKAILVLQERSFASILRMRIFRKGALASRISCPSAQNNDIGERLLTYSMQIPTPEFPRNESGISFGDMQRAVPRIADVRRT